MTKELKIIAVGAALCIAGGIAIDLGLAVTGVVLICLGVIGVVAGPMAANF